MAKDQAGIRAEMETRLAAIRGRLTEINETLREPEDDDFQEQAAEKDEDDVLELMSHAAQTEAELIEAALRRMDSNTYGACLSCGKPIAKGRLRAIPEAERCVTCAQRTRNF